MQDNSFETSFEKGANLGGSSFSGETIDKADAWSNAMSDAGEGPSYFGAQNTASEKGSSSAEETVDSYNQDIADGAAILNYGLNGAAAQLGVDVVINGIKSFDVSNSERPIHDLLNSLGIDTKPEFKELHENQVATNDNKNAFYHSDNAPQTMNRSDAGARQAIRDMQELISAVEKDDKDYSDLRDAAKANNKTVFEQAVSNCKVQDLASLFGVLADIKREKSQQTEDTENETDDQVVDNDVDDVDNDNDKEKSADDTNTNI